MTLTSDTLPLSTLNEFAEVNIGQRLSTLDGVAQVTIFGPQKYRRSGPGRSRAARGPRHRARRGAKGAAGRELEHAGRRVQRAAESRDLASQDPAHQGGELRAADHRLSQRGPGAAARRRPGPRRRRAQQERQLVQRQARHHGRGLPPAGRQYRPGRGPDQGLDPGLSRRAAGRGRDQRAQRPRRADQGGGPRRAVHARPHRDPGHPGHLPVRPAGVRHDHSGAGAAGVDRRHFCRPCISAAIRSTTSR